LSRSGAHLCAWRECRARLAGFIRERVAQRRASQGSDLFTQLCQARDEAGKQYSDEEIVDHLIFIMMAAHDTTTSAITTMVFALAHHRPACLGLHFAEMQVKAVLLPLLRNCKWSVPAAYVPDYAYAPIAKPRDGLPIRLVRV
jgi:cytochrome P450